MLMLSESGDDAIFSVERKRQSTAVRSKVGRKFLFCFRHGISPACFSFPFSARCFARFFYFFGNQLLDLSIQRFGLTSFLHQLLPQVFFFFIELLYFRFLFRFLLLQFPAFLLASIEQGYFIRTRLPQFFPFLIQLFLFSDNQ